MKSIADNGPRDASVPDVPDAKVEKPTDTLIGVITSNTRGSDPGR